MTRILFVPAQTRPDDPDVMCGSAGQPLVSIVIASYNRAQLVARAVRSALAQSYPNVEVIVSDDCSPDDTMRVLSEITDVRLRLFCQSQNRGPWENWNSALRRARGKFVVFLGDDDMLSADFVESTTTAFFETPSVDAVLAPHKHVDADGHLLVSYQPPISARCAVGPDILIYGLPTTPLFFGAALFRHSAVSDIWELTKPDGMVADWGLIFRLGLISRIDVVASQGGCYTKLAHSVQLSSQHIAVSRSISELFERLTNCCRSTKERRHFMRLASLERVTLARHHAALTQWGDTRAELLTAIRVFPWHFIPYSQLIQSLICPKRLERTASRQRGASVGGKHSG